MNRRGWRNSAFGMASQELVMSGRSMGNPGWLFYGLKHLDSIENHPDIPAEGHMNLVIIWSVFVMRVRSLVVAGILAELLFSGVTLAANGESSERKSCHDAQLESAEPAARIYAVSPFVHGYRDGYQQGFHDTDISLQFAHEPSPAESMRNYRDVHYRSEFGEKESYVSGYRAGFRRGVADMLEGRDLRVFSMLAIATERGLAQSATFTLKPSAFDNGVRQGYLQEASPTGRRAGSAECAKDASGAFCAGVRFGEAFASAEAERVETAGK
jgi:hypothetical protein